MTKRKKHSNKKAQEEMIGFALIIVLVSVILLAFLGFSLSKTNKQAVEDYEVQNFIQSFLQYTTDCQDSDYLSVQDLIFECDAENTCSDGRESCEVLNETLKDILNESWPVGPDRPEKGYELIIDSEDELILDLKAGNITRQYKGGSQPLTKRRKNFNIAFNAYF